MISTLIFNVWWISACAMALVSLFVWSKGISSGAYPEWNREKWCGVNDPEWSRAWTNIGLVILTVGVSAAGVFGFIAMLPVMSGIGSGRKKRRKQEAQKEALKTLAQYENDAIARRALERGDGAAYVDRLLDLDKKKVLA